MTIYEACGRNLSYLEPVKKIITIVLSGKPNMQPTDQLSTSKLTRDQSSVQTKAVSSSSKSYVYMITLGCARNRVDSEVMLGLLGEGGWGVAENSKDADVIIVNTCGFIQAAKEESIDTILEMAKLKEKKPSLKLIVAGCLSQRYKNQLAKGLPEVDFFVGVDEFSKIKDYITSNPSAGSVFAKRTHYLYSEHLPRLNTLNKISAYVKIAEGCQHQCSFCIIPAIRGKLRSRPIQSVVAEVNKLVDGGVKEVNLIAQDLAAYGRERGVDELLPLLRELVKIKDLYLVRLLYVYPENIDDELLDFIADQPKIAKYLDIPVQHASNKILKAMKRDIDQEGLEAVLKKVRQKIPEMNIRTTVMVGFPGETQDDFEQLLSFVEEQKFDHLGCFTYSQEPGTVAARLPDQIDQEIMDFRQSEIMSRQKSISKQKLERYIGKTFPVLVEGTHPETNYFYVARAEWQAPEVDGSIIINEGDAKIGQVHWVEVVDAYEYDLLAKIVPQPRVH